MCVEGRGVSFGYGPPPSALEFSKYMQQIYKNCLDYLLNLAIVRISLEKNMVPPIIGFSLARSNLYEIAVKSSIIFIKGPLFYLFLRLVQINGVFSANVHILYISLSLSIYVTIYFIY